MVIHYGKAVLEKQRVTATFKRYAAPEIVDEILRQGTQSLELGGKLTQLAVLFVDIRGFTSMSEALEPGQVVEVLNSYLTLVSSSIKNHGGTLDKFIGDAAMAFWGAPLAQEDYVMKLSWLLWIWQKRRTAGGSAGGTFRAQAYLRNRNPHRSRCGGKCGGA